MKDQCRRCGVSRYVDPPLPFISRRVTCEKCLFEQWYDWCNCKGGIVDRGACSHCDKDAKGSLPQVAHIGQIGFIGNVLRVAGKPVLTCTNVPADQIILPVVCTQILLRVDAAG
jgi:hypothetical protein